MNRELRIFDLVLIVGIGVTLGQAGRIFPPSGLYIELEQEYSWFDAAMKCAQMNMSLLALDSQEMIKTLAGLSFDEGRFGNPIMWLGGTSLAKKGFYEWISTGASFVLTTANHQNRCVVFVPVGNGKRSVECNENHGFICEPNRILQAAKKELNDLKASIDAQNQKLDDVKNSGQVLGDKENQLEELRKMVKMSEGNLKDVEKRNKTYERFNKKLENLQKDLVVVRNTNANQLEKVKHKRKELNEAKKVHDTQTANKCKETWQLAIKLRKALEVQMDITKKLQKQIDELTKNKK
ncbi:uncharacterized protein LOC106088717 [Stomoxys calcitrans]|uniref:uncharacterized protein LOC106088717 n=1 Tax=Stomoxys calcitrans TaxID=35570 RepID=UPI0027E2FE3B|nr:uncharacterized protein LOC106088717 [Stomoxys calcitrans]